MTTDLEILCQACHQPAADVVFRNGKLELIYERQGKEVTENVTL
jgi:hypothetical protein